MRNRKNQRRTQLQSCSAEELSRFLDGLADENDEIAKAVDLFLAAKNPAELIKVTRNRINAIKRRKSFLGRRFAGEMAQDLHAVLDAIERDLLSAVPAEALPLLARFIETDGSVLGRADDSSGLIGDAYRRASRLFGKAAEAAGQPPEGEKLFMQLREGADYGTRDALYEQAKQIFRPEALQRLIADWRAQARAEDFDDFGGVRIRLAQIAESAGDPELFEEATLAGRPKDAYPLLAFEVARVYLACGQPDKAIDKLPLVNNPAFLYQRGDLLLQIHQALGNTAEIRHILWERFEEAAYPHAAQAYLNALPKDEHEAALARMREIVRGKRYRAFAQARFFAENGDPAAAAEIVENRSDEFHEEFYGDLLELAKKLEPGHPLATSALYRAVMEFTLGEGKSKNYGYAVRYARKLSTLAPTISDWKALTPHAEYWKVIQETHKRRSAFWERMKKT